MSIPISWHSALTPGEAQGRKAAWDENLGA